MQLNQRNDMKHASIWWNALSFLFAFPACPQNIFHQTVHLRAFVIKIEDISEQFNTLWAIIKYQFKTDLSHD